MHRLGPALMLASALLAGGSSSAAPSEPPRMGVITQWSGQHGGGERSNTRVLRTAAEWDTFWQAVKRESPQPLNPSREIAVVIEMGGRRTGGFSVEVLGAAERDGKLVVDYREHAPDPGMMVVQVLTSPWVIAVLPQSNLPVMFRRIPGTPARQER